MALLPSFFILQSGSKYLSLTENVPPSLPSGFLKFDEEQIWSPRVKFAAEPAKSGDGRFVHIRSLYNNKYLVKKKSWIVASARKPEEDTSKDSCTLFEPFSQADDQPTSVRLRQVLIDDDEKKNSVVVTLSASSSDEGMLQVAAAASSSSSSSSGSVFSVIDRASLVVLPSQVAFRHNDDLYMRAYNDIYNWERFDSGFTISDPLLAKELIPTANGNYRIKDLHWGKLLKYNSSWIWADSTDQSIKDTEFSFVHIEDNVFGIRSLGNNRFCGPLTADNKTRCLNAYYPSLTQETRLIVEERVLKREIFDVEYRVADAIIYDEKPYAIRTQTIPNSSPDSEITATLTFTKTQSRTTSWTNTQTINFGVTVSMTVTVVPLIVDMGIELTYDGSSTREWGESKTTETTTEVSYAVTVPPGKTYYVNFMATMGTCDIPFSYTQRDLLTTGDTVVTRKHDGLYTCHNNYNFIFTVQQNNLLIMDDDHQVTTTTALPFIKDAADVRG